MAYSMNKKNLKKVMYMTAVVIFLYIPLNICYVILAPMLAGQSRAGQSVESNLKGASGIPLRVGRHDVLHLKDIQMGNDGSVDLKLNLDMVGMIKLLNAYSDGSFIGEMTSNPLPVKFNFLTDNSHVCENVPNLNMLIYVHTAAKNSARRKILRATWARRGLFKDDLTRLVFLLGRPKDEAEQKIIREENASFRDLVVGDFNDHYRNLTLKAIMGLKWTSSFCRNAKYVVKADDDAFVNIFELQKILKANEDKKRLLMCPLWKENTMPILRDPAKCMKWCVKFNEFPGKTHFPKYCAGLAFIMSQEVVPQLYQESLKTPFFWIDDVYISGVVVPKVKGIEYIDLLRNFTLKEKLASEEYLDEKKPVSYYFAHVKTPETFYKMWNATLHRLEKDELSSLSKEVLDEHPGLSHKLKR